MRQYYQSSSRRVDMFARALHGLPYEERERIVLLMGIDPRTYLRWEKGETTPHPKHIDQLVRLLPLERRISLAEELAKKETRFHPLAQSIKAPLLHTHIPSVYYQRVLSTMTTSPASLRESATHLLVMQQLLQLLDPLRQGCRVSLYSCTPPERDEVVRSLYHRISSGMMQHPLPNMDLFLVGENSLVGQCIALERPVIFSGEQTVQFPPIHSLLAYPIALAGRGVTGVLSVMSPKDDFFTQEHRLLCEDYATLLALLPGSLFYQDIALCTLPDLPLQIPVIEEVMQFKGSESEHLHMIEQRLLY